MAYKITWFDEAITSFETSNDYLKTYFTDKEISKFIEATSDKLRLIENNPNSYRRSSPFNNIYYTNILRKVILVYRSSVV